MVVWQNMGWAFGVKQILMHSSGVQWVNRVDFLFFPSFLWVRPVGRGGGNERWIVAFCLARQLLATILIIQLQPLKVYIVEFHMGLTCFLNLNPYMHV